MKDLVKINQQIDALSKEELAEAGARFAVRLMESGEESPLRLHVQAKRLLEYVTAIFKTTRVEAAIEYGSHGEKTVKLWNARITEVGGSDILDYEQDVVFADLKARLSERKALLDLRAKNGREMYDDEGVAVPLVRPKGARRPSLHIRF